MSYPRKTRTVHLRWIVPALAMGIAATGCSADDTSPRTTSTSTSTSTGTGGAGAGGAGGAGVQYGACADGYLSECAKISVPLDHQKPSGEAIDFHFSRIPATTQPAARQVWVLAGGPGQAGYVFKDIIADIASRLPDADIFVPDHRGTGYSHRLQCPQQDQPNTYGGYSLDPTKGAACLDALKQSGDYDKLPYFTTTQAAADVLEGIEAVRTSPTEKVFVWGGSYGTHWAHRILQLGNTHLDGVIFDGYLTPRHFAFIDYDRGAEEVGEAFAHECDLDASCSAHVGAGGALAKIQSVLSGLDTKPCDGFNKTIARSWISQLLGGWFSRSAVFPAIHRLERCNAADVTALNFFINYYNDLLTKSYDTPFVNSGILQYNIVLSELWSNPGEAIPTQAEMNAAAEAQTFLAGQSYPASLVTLRTEWPLPPDDYSAFPVPVESNVKLLWLGASLDEHTYLSQANLIGSVYPNAPHIVLKDASHVPSEQSPLAADPTDQCGEHIVTSFIEGDGAIDESCEALMLPIRFEAPTGAAAMKYWGTTDDWGDGTPKPLTKSPFDALAEDRDVIPSAALMGMRATRIVRP